MNAQRWYLGIYVRVHIYDINGYIYMCVSMQTIRYKWIESVYIIVVSMYTWIRFSTCL